jgi:hypothetical protein
MWAAQPAVVLRFPEVHHSHGSDHPSEPLASANQNHGGFQCFPTCPPGMEIAANAALVGI